MADKTYIFSTGRKTPKPRSKRLRECGGASYASSSGGTVTYVSGGSSESSGSGADGFSPTISFTTDGSTLVITVTNRGGSETYRIDLGKLSGVDELRAQFEECCERMETEVAALKDTIDGLKEMMGVVTFTIAPTPADAIVAINGEARTSIDVLAGAAVSWSVSADGYITQSGVATVTETMTLEVVLADVSGLITALSYDDIPAAGGTVTPSVTALEGCVLTYSGDGVDPSTGAVSADSLGTTVKDRAKVATATVTATLDGQSVSRSCDVYQGENRVESSDEEVTYSDVAVTGGHVYDDIPAGGGSVTPTAPTYSQTRSVSYTDTYTSGATARRTDLPSEVTSGASVSYSGTGVNTSTGAVSADSLGTTVKARTQIATATVTVTLNGKSGSLASAVWQEENKVVSTSDSDSYSDVALTGGHVYNDIPAGGGSVTPTAPTYSQTHTWGHTETYTSGAVDDSGGGSETLTTGASVAYSGTGVDTSTGAVSADSLGTTVKARTQVATSTVTVTLNGKSGSLASAVWQEANERTDTREESSYSDVTLTGGHVYNDIPAGGGSVTPTAPTYSQTKTTTTYTQYTSGAELGASSTETLTSGGSVAYSGSGVNTSTGAVTADSLGTTVKSRSSVATSTVTVTLNGKSGSLASAVWQEENKVVSTVTDFDCGDVEVSLSYGDIPAEGGTVYPSLSYSQTVTPTTTDTYTSGATEQRTGSPSEVTSGGSVTYSGDGVDPSTGSVTAGEAGTARALVATATAAVTLNGVTGSARAEVWQEARTFCRLTVNATPANASVEIQTTGNMYAASGSLTVEVGVGEEVTVTVTAEGYEDWSETLTVNEDTVLDVALSFGYIIALLDPVEFPDAAGSVGTFGSNYVLLDDMVSTNGTYSSFSSDNANLTVGTIGIVLVGDEPKYGAAVTTANANSSENVFTLTLTYTFSDGSSKSRTLNCVQKGKESTIIPIG